MNNSYYAAIAMLALTSIVTAADLTVNVPAGETATLDATQVTEDITNIRKTGDGDLEAVALPDYTGDFTLEGGRFILNQNGDLGKDGVGTCYVNDGASLCYRKNDMIARGEKIVFAGRPAEGYRYKFARLKIPSGYSETWKYFSDSASVWTATDSDVVFASEGNRLQMLGKYDANGHDLIFDQRYAANWGVVQFNCGLKISNGRDLIIGFEKEADGTTYTTKCAQLLTESGQMSLSSKDGNSHLIVNGNTNTGTKNNCISLSQNIKSDGEWTIVLNNAELRLVQPKTPIQHTWNGKIRKNGLYARIVLGTGVTSLLGPDGKKLYPLSGFVIRFRGVVQDLVRYYGVIFKSASGETLRSQKGIAKDGSPVGPYMDSETEVLSGWKIDGTTYSSSQITELPVTSDLVATAVMTPRTHTVKFLDSDGLKVLKSTSVAHGSAAVPPSPTKSGFTFVKWDRPYTNVVDDLTVRAVWRSSAKPSSYQDVTTYSYDGFFGIGKFSPLVPNDPSAADNNATYLSSMISKVGSGGVLYFPKGKYYIGSCITISSAGVTLWGEPGAEFIRTGVSNTNSTAYPDNAESGNYNWASFMVIAAKSVTIRGLTFRYSVPTCFTAEILSVKSDGSQTARLTDGRDAEFNANLRFQRINNFRADGYPLSLDLVYGAGTTAGTHYKQASQISTGSDGRKTFTLWLGKDKVNVGDRVTLCCSTAYSQAFILYGALSTISDLVFEDVTVANAFAMTMVVKNVNNLTLRRFRVEDDTPGALFATGMDGIHIAGLSGKLTMEECELRGLADDMLNVHATAGVVGSVSGNKVTLAKEVESGSFSSGDTVKFYTAKLAELGTAKISSGGTSNFTVDALPTGVTTNCLIGNETKMPEVEITGCRFGVTRARGILLQTDAKIVVKNCEFFNTRLAGMLLSPSATGQWTEMGPIRDALITNCVFNACGVAEASTDGKNNGSIVIRCNHDADNSWAFDKAANRNIRIVGNEFNDGCSAGVFAANTKDLLVSGNTFNRCGGRVKTLDEYVVRAEYCTNVGVTNNTANASQFIGTISAPSTSGYGSMGNLLWYDVRFLDADGTVIGKTRASLNGRLGKPAWSENLTTAEGVLDKWVKVGETAAYDFSSTVKGPFDLQATYIKRP